MHSGGLARYFSLILFYYLLPPCITYTTLEVITLILLGQLCL